MIEMQLLDIKLIEIIYEELYKVIITGITLAVKTKL